MSGAEIPASMALPVSMAQLRGSVATTVAALKGISAVVHQNLSSELAGVVGELDQLRALAEAGLIVATCEAEQRGVIEQSQCASTAAWVRDAAWHLQTGGSAAVAKCVAILRRHDLGSLPDAIRITDITPSVAVTVAAEYDKLSPRLSSHTHDRVLDLMIDIGAEHGSGAVKQLHQEILARWGEDGEFQDEQDAKKRYVELSSGSDDGGIYRYELTVDAEGRAVLEAAIGPLCKPQPGPDGEADPRPVGRRRGEALVEVCRRATAAGERLPGATKTQLFITMNLDDLQNASGAGCTLGSLDGGSLLGPETVRKMACDAAIIPVVLGSDGEILDVGRTQRLFTSPTQGPVATRPALHLPRLSGPGPLDRRPSPETLDRWRVNGSHQRRPTLRPASHRGSSGSVGRHPRRRASAVGPKTRLLSTTITVRRLMPRVLNTAASTRCRMRIHHQ